MCVTQCGPLKTKAPWKSDFHQVSLPLRKDSVLVGSFKTLSRTPQATRETPMGLYGEDESMPTLSSRVQNVSSLLCTVFGKYLRYLSASVQTSLYWHSEFTSSCSRFSFHRALETSREFPGLYVDPNNAMGVDVILIFTYSFYVLNTFRASKKILRNFKVIP